MENKMNILKFKFILIFSLIFLSKSVFSQESNTTSNDVVSIKDSVKIAVIDMQKILNESVAYQGVVEQFENIRRKHRNKMTKLEDEIRDSENNLFKQKNIISKESYAEKVQELSKRINEIKAQKNNDVKRFEVSFEKATNKIQKALIDVLSSIASNMNLDLVMAKSQVLLVGNNIDLTDIAVKELNKVLPKVKLDLK
jgi:Skp family chaperone for outer membrane proteins